MINFLEETKNAISKANYTTKDIVFIGSQVSGHQCTWEEFEGLANFEYDNWYGVEYIPSDLVIVFSSGEYLWRVEYDGSEWWGHVRNFKKPESVLPIRALINKAGGYCTISNIKENIEESRI
jgi:hypothetical protein